MVCCCNFNWNFDVTKCLGALCSILRRPKSSIRELKNEMKRLGAKKGDIMDQIDQAEREGKIRTNEVDQWLMEVETLEDQVTVIEQDFQSCFSCYDYYSINRRAAEKLGEINKLMNHRLDPIATDLSRPNSIEELEREMSKLRSKREDIKYQIDQAERNGQIRTNEVSRWLTDVEMLEDQMIDIKQDFRRAAEKLREVNKLMNQACALDPIVRVGPHQPTATVPIAHQPPVGIESYVKCIVGYIDGDGEDKIIGIYGMGGVGKTTILNSIHQHYLKHNKFDHVIWVVASKGCNLKRLQMDIAKRLDLKTLRESDNEQTCGENLFDYLKNRNCLLLLDDIWEHVDLQRLGMAHSATEQGQQQQPRKVVVLTTRSEIVCGRMEAKKKMRVECLDPDQAWQLFEQKCEKDVLSDPGIKSHAGELVKECAGLPLALVTVAGAMTGKKSSEAWEYALHQIKYKHEWTNIGLGHSEESHVMYKAFKLSYDSLENNSIRECLLCCALWSEDYEMNKFEDLIPCWIGCGIIRKFNVINEAFTEGCSYLDALMAVSLLEHSSKQEYLYREKYVKMHDVIRDMALLMVSGLEGNERKWIVKAEIGLRHLPSQEEQQEAERASFMGDQITHLPEYGASTFPKLSMLILKGNKNLKTIPPSLFASMPHLTYLDIARCRIKKLPMEICSLTELQYLDLSYDPITRLPAKFGCLGKLEYLLLSYTYIETVPDGIISNLSMLRWLDIRENPLSMVDWWLNELEYFKGPHQLSVGICIDDTTRNIKRLNRLPNVFIWDLAIRRDDAPKLSDFTKNGDEKLNFSTPQWCDNISNDLESLKIDLVEVDELIFAKSRFGSLKMLQFFGLRLLEKISLNGVQLNNLRELYIVGCTKLKDVSWVLQLHCLVLLEISNCQEMKELISDAGNSISHIKTLNLWDLRNLTCIENQPFHFHFLEYIHVGRCPEFKNLSGMWESELKEIHGDETWWHNIEWNHDEYNKNFLTPLFIPTR